MGYMKKTSAPWFYHSACAWASEGRDEEALAHLDIAIKLGFAKYDLIKGGKEWDALRGNPEFQALVEKVREVGDYLYVLKKSRPIGKVPVRCLHLRTNRPRTVIWYVCVAISIWTA